MKEIPLTQGQVALVDDEDYDYLNQWKWQTHFNGTGYYGKRNIRLESGKRTSFMLHRAIITDVPLGMQVDHIDGNGLNNQRNNLRIVTNRQNQQNLHRDKTSIYPGVCWGKRNNKWVSKIRIGNKVKHLGYFINEKDAFDAYCNALTSINEALVNNF